MKMTTEFGLAIGGDHHKTPGHIFPVYSHLSRLEKLKFLENSSSSRAITNVRLTKQDEQGDEQGEEPGDKPYESGLFEQP